MHTIEKTDEICVLALSAAQGRIRQTISDEKLRAIAQSFGVTLNEEFLDVLAPGAFTFPVNFRPFVPN